MPRQDPYDDPRRKPLIIGQKHTHRYTPVTPRAVSAPSSLTPRYKYSDQYFSSLPNFSSLPTGRSNVRSNLIRFSDIEPITQNALKLRMTQAFQSMSFVIEEMHKTGKISDEKIRETTKKKNELEITLKNLSSLNKEELFKLRDDLANFFTQQFIESVLASRETSVRTKSGEEIVKVKGYDLPEKLLKSGGDLLTSYRYSQTTVPNLIEYIKTPIPKNVNISPRDIEVRGITTITRELRTLYRYNAEVLFEGNFDSSDIENYTLAYHHLRIHYGYQHRKKIAGREVHVLAKSGGIKSQRDLIALVEEKHSRHNLFDVRVAPLVDLSKPLPYPHFFDRHNYVNDAPLLRVSDGEYEALVYADNLIKELAQSEGHMLRGVSIFSCAGCGITTNLFELKHPEIKIIDIPQQKIMKMEEIESWDVETEQKTNGKLNFSPTVLDDQTIKISMLKWIEITQKRRETALELIPELNKNGVQGINYDEIEFKQLHQVEADLVEKERPIYRVKDGTFVYIEIEDTKQPKIFVKIRPHELGIKPEDTKIKIGKRHPEKILSQDVTSSLHENAPSTPRLDSVQPQEQQPTESSEFTFADLVHQSALSTNEDLDTLISIQLKKTSNDYEQLSEELASYEYWKEMLNLGHPAFKSTTNDESYLHELKNLEAISITGGESRRFMQELKSFVESTERRAVHPDNDVEKERNNQLQEKNRHFMELAKLFYFNQSELSIDKKIKNAGTLMSKLQSHAQKEMEEKESKRDTIKLLEYIDTTTVDKMNAYLDNFFKGPINTINTLDDTKLDKIFGIIKELNNTASELGVMTKGSEQQRKEQLESMMVRSYERRLEKEEIPAEMHAFLKEVRTLYNSKQDKAIHTPGDILREVFFAHAEKIKFKQTMSRIKAAKEKLPTSNMQAISEKLELVESAYKKTKLPAMTDEAAAEIAKKSLGKISSPFGGYVDYSVRSAHSIGKNTIVTAQVKKVDKDFAVLREQTKSGAFYCVIDTPSLLKASGATNHAEIIEKKFTFEQGSNNNLIIQPFRVQAWAPPRLKGKVKEGGPKR